jgi:hypothetical protein
MSVRALMLLILALGCWLGWYVQRVRVQQAAVAAIRHAGGFVAYDWQWGDYNPDIIDPDGKPRMPKWLARHVGADYVANVVHVTLAPSRANDPNGANDETLAHIGRLSRLEFLSLNDTAVTDAGLAHLKGLTKLNQLDLWHTQIGDTGLGHLKGLSSLRLILLAGTQATDDGVLELERALPEAHILREEDMVSIQTSARATDDLEFARSQPIRLAAILLANRAKAMASRGNQSEYIATLHALCDLEADDKVSLFKLAERRADCLWALERAHLPNLPDSRRRALRRLCVDRALAAATRAVELRYSNVPRAEKLLDTLRAMRASP